MGRGEEGRAGGTVLYRAGTSSTGTIAVQANRACPSLYCALSTWGMINP